MLYVLMMVIGAGIGILAFIYGHAVASRLWKEVIVGERAAKERLEAEVAKLKAKL